MTVGYVATSFDIAAADLAEGLGMAADTPPETTLGSIANGRGLQPLPFVKRVQATVAGLVPVAPVVDVRARRERASDDVLSVLLEYRYPAFALVLLVGAIGVPVPTGFSTVLAGSMAAIGEMNLYLAAATAIGASVVGDAIGYAIGRLADESLLTKWGRWIGYTPRRQARLKRLFARWGGVSVVLTRTLVSPLSSLASLVAGIGRYSFEAFIGFAILGRVLWTIAYLSLGYVIGNNVEAAGTFLGHITGLVLSVGVIAILGSYLLAPFLRSSRAAA
jgi:membrane protein DedA with SNARE-associated domain